MNPVNTPSGSPDASLSGGKPRADLRHEILTPLGQILGYTDLLIEDAEANGCVGLLRDLGKIRAAGRQLHTLIDETNGPAGTAANHVAVQPAGAAPEARPVRDARFAAILVVDDEEENREILRRRLLKEGFQVAVAPGGQDALRQMGEFAFDVVLLDILMPDVSGFDVLSKMQGDPALQHTPVIVISALDDLESVVRCIEMGAEDYLPKPFNPVLLHARISASLEKKRLRDAERSLYAQLQANHARLQGLERLRDDLTNMIVHDLRQPLTSFLVGVRSVPAMGPLNAQQRDCLDAAVAGGEMLLGMISDLLDIGRMEGGALTLLTSSVSISGLMREAADQVAWVAREKGLTLDIVDEPDAEICADEEKMRRALVNLIGNAVKFTPAGGRITVSCRHEADCAVFCVGDTGDGIPEEALSRIFDKFGQVETRQAGRLLSTGLGLTFCKMVAEAHGGRAWAESRLGEGSRFQIAIPLGAAGSGAAA